MIGGLAALTGLRSALERHRPAVDEKRTAAYRKEFQELSARHREEEAPLTRGYRTLKTRERMREEAALARAREMQVSAQFNEEVRRGSAAGESGEDAREMKKERSWTRREDERGRGHRRGPPDDGDDGPPTRKRRKGRGYGHRR